VLFSPFGSVSSLLLSDATFVSILASRLLGSDSVVGESDVFSDTGTVVTADAVFVLGRSQFISIDCLLLLGVVLRLGDAKDAFKWWAASLQGLGFTLLAAVYL